jgi:hypothetical protein
MSTTTAPPAAEVAVDPFGLDEAATLAFVVDRRRRQDQAAAEELRGVTQWADLHRVTGGEVGSIDPALVEAMFPIDSEDKLLGREGELRLAGQGAFTVTEFAVCQLAAALAMSEPAARAYVGQAVELRDRLPRLWAAVMGGTLPAWMARKIAEQTIPLNAAAAAYVDAQLAPFAHQLSLTRIMRAVEAAVLRHDPDLAAEQAAKAADGRGVWVDDDLHGTSTITAVTTTPDAAAFEAAVHRVACDLARLGSTAPEQIRRATAVGVLADPQHALTLHTAVETGDQPRARKTRPHPVLHVHLHADAVTGVPSADGTGHLARVERFGARSLETVQHWLTALAPGATIKVTPVVDLTEHISVDAYEIPDRLRTQIAERDDGCRFPWCGRQGVFDVDHIDPYVPTDDGGPPGQTNTRNLARLCRFHHRVKTHGRWRYRRDDAITLTWTSPLGRIYTVDEHGTRPISR